MGRRARIAATGLFVAVLVAPVVADHDSFPLSTYPMYARTRTSRITLPTAYGVEAGGDLVRLSLAIIGGSDDPLIVAADLRNAISGGRTEQRCEQIAERLGPESGLVGVEVVSERHDTVARTLDEPSLIERTVHATCRVPST